MLLEIKELNLEAPVSLKFKFPYLQHLQGRKVNQTLARSLSLSLEI